MAVEQPELPAACRRDAAACAAAECEARAARVDRLRSARADRAVRSGRQHEGDRAVGARVVAPADRGVHALGQRVRGDVAGAAGAFLRSIASTRCRTRSGSWTSRRRRRRSGTHSGMGSLPVRKITMKSDRRDAEAEVFSRARDSRAPQQHEMPGVDPGDAADVSETGAANQRDGGGAHPGVPDAAVVEAGAVRRTERRTLCAG